MVGSEPIEITSQPLEETFVDESSGAQISVAAKGGFPREPLQYQWRRYEEELRGEEGSVLALSA